MEYETRASEYLEFVVRDGLRQRNRGALDIVNSILSASLSGALKTHILYKCNLSSRQISQYLEFLLNRGLLEQKLDSSQSREIYVTTAVGQQFIELYRDLCKILLV